MKKVILTSLLIAITNVSFAQSHNITSAAIILKQYISEKDKSIKAIKIGEAKEFIDEAFANENTSNEPKMWMYRAQIYKQIALNHNTLDYDAIFKSTESHLKCMQPHAKKKNKIMIYKKWPREEVLEGLVQCGDKLFRLAVEEHTSGDYKSALRHYTAIFDILPFDEEDQLKRGNITKETILYNSFFSSNKMKDNTKSKELLQELININFNEPQIYSYLSSILIEEGNMDKALEYLLLGRDMFEDDQNLINTEINLYIRLNRTEELIARLSSNIESYPDNDIYYVIRGTCYQNSDNLEKSILDYKSALAINPDHLTALNNISACYLKQTEPLVIKLNNLTYNQTSLHNKYKEKINQIHLSALPYLENYSRLEPSDISILTVLGEIYYKLEMYQESKDIKKQIAELK